MAQKITLSFVLLLLMTSTTFGQYSMEITAGYNIPISTDFKGHFQNGYGGNMEIIYDINESGLAVSVLFGLNGFSAQKSYEEELAENNSTLFNYDYKINYYSFPLLLQAKYTLFNEKEFQLTGGFGLGMEFMEQKEKQTGEFTSDYRKEKFNEFAIYPNIGLSYHLAEGINAVLKSGFHQTFGKKSLSYIDLRLGIIYKI